MTVRRTRFLTASGVGAILIALSLSLSGCFGIPNIPGVPGDGGTVNLPDGGAVNLPDGMGRLPDDFPTSVPLVGTVGFGYGFEEDGKKAWVVTTTFPTSTPNADTAADDAMLGAGFTSSTPGFYEGKGLQIVVFSLTEGDTVSTQYAVTTE